MEPVLIRNPPAKHQSKTKTQIAIECGRCQNKHLATLCDSHCANVISCCQTVHALVTTMFTKSKTMKQLKTNNQLMPDQPRKQIAPPNNCPCFQTFGSKIENVENALGQ